jgi:hypothetical protein
VQLARPEHHGPYAGTGSIDGLIGPPPYRRAEQRQENRRVGRAVVTVAGGRKLLRQPRPGVPAGSPETHYLLPREIFEQCLGAGYLDLAVRRIEAEWHPVRHGMAGHFMPFIHHPGNRSGIPASLVRD